VRLSEETTELICAIIGIIIMVASVAFLFILVAFGGN
jgi:hypothetical protein